MTPEEQQKKTQLEQQINVEFSQLQKRLGDLKGEVQSETDETKKQEKGRKIQEMETELSEIGAGKEKLERMTSLQEQDLESLKTRLESLKLTIQNFKGEVVDLQNEKSPTPTTCELLKNTETYNKLLNIISSNPDSFKGLPGENAEKKLEYIFEKIRDGIVQFLKNKLGESENVEKVINNTIAPAFERNLMEMLRDQGNETNVGMLKGMDGISWDNLGKLFNGVKGFADKFSSSYGKFNQWVNAIDYLSVHNGVLNNPNQSEVLSNPLKFKEYMNDAKFVAKEFSPYTAISDNIFKIDENQNFEFGMSLQEKQNVLSQIGNIQVVNNPRTTALIARMLDKPAEFLRVTPELQKTANGLLDGASAINSVTKIFGKDIIGEISKAPEQRTVWFKVLDFVCKLIGITGGLEGVVKRWRLDRLDLTDEKNHSISQIFKEYQKVAGKGSDVSITDSNCSAVLAEFNLTDLDKQSTTKGDYLRDVISNNISINLISPAIVQQTLGNDYLKKEVVQLNGGKQQEKLVVNAKKIEQDHKERELAHKHLQNMKAHLEGNYNDLKDFYSNIHNTDDLVVCMTTALYADKDDVIEGVKAKVFLPENYGVVYAGGVESATTNTPETASISDLTQSEQTEMQNLVEQSKTPNRICYLENATYKKYLNIIERDLKLPKYALECVCSKESGGGYLYNSNGNILGSPKGAQGLFQFMPETADQYMVHNQLKEKYGKTFSSRDEFLKDPLATAWVAGIMYSEFLSKGYSFQSALACYNRGEGHYKGKFKDKKALASGDLEKLPNETKKYVEDITKDVLAHNSASSSDILADLGQYSRGGTNSPISSIA